MTATGKQPEIMTALFTHTALLETAGPQLPIDFPESLTFVTPDDNKWLKVTYFPNVPAWQAMATGRFDQGLLQIVTYWPKNEGLISPGNVAQQVFDHFAKGTELVSGTTKVKIVADPWFSSNLPEDDVVGIPVTIPWAS